MEASEGTITVTVGRAEALVLFEMLAGFYRQPVLEIRGPAERLALVRLFGALEKTLVEPFMPDYLDLIKTARSELAVQSGEQ